MELKIENTQGQRRAKIATAAYVALCCLFLFTLKCEKSEEQSNMGITVNLGTVESGMNPDNIPTAKNTEEVTEEPITEEVVTETAVPNEIEAVTQDVVETDIVASEEVAAEPTPTNTTPTEVEPAPEPEPEPQPEPKPTVNENALFSGSNNANQGTGNTSGDQGNPEGNLESDIYGDIAGSGLGSDGKGWGLKGRGLVSKPQPTNPTNEYGNVTIKITVDKYGNVVKAEFTSFNSTTTNSALRDIAINEAYKVKFNNVASDGKARDKQVGYVVFKFQAN